MNCEWFVESSDDAVKHLRCTQCGRELDVQAAIPNHRVRATCGGGSKNTTVPCALTLDRHESGVDEYRCVLCNQALTVEAGVSPPRRICRADLCEACSCDGPGYCERHRMSKSEIVYQICQNDAKQRLAWDYITATGKSLAGTKPSQARRAWNFGLASIRHLFTGAGTRSDEEIERIIQICQTCPSGMFNGRTCESLKCGCTLDRRKHFSKIAWESEHCPEDHW